MLSNQQLLVAITEHEMKLIKAKTPEKRFLILDEMDFLKKLIA